MLDFIFRRVVASFTIGVCLISLASVGGCGGGNGKDAPPEDPPLRAEDAPDDVQLPDPKHKGATKDLSPIRPRAVFMGTEAHGRRFCIIADASNSVAGPPLAQLKKEILQTVEGLTPSCQFYVIFFNAGDIPMPHPNWLNATPENVAKVKPWIEKMGVKLGTKPASSFARAFQLEPRPDVIFFLTDGQLQQDVASQLSRINVQEPKVIVHTLLFSRGKGKAKVEGKLSAAGERLRVIAEQNGGTFRHVTQK